MNSIVEFVEHLGGPAALLQHCPRDKMSPLRFCCEQLAVRDVFGCFASERSPRILNIAFTPWFFDAESWSQGDDEWESVERMFGISRGMTDILARVSASWRAWLTASVLHSHRQDQRERTQTVRTYKPGRFQSTTTSSSCGEIEYLTWQGVCRKIHRYQ